MASSKRGAQTPHLPDELWVQILEDVPAQDLWCSVLHVNRQLRSCAESAVTTEAIRHFTIGVQFSLGSGHHHRWYDVRGAITFSFISLNRRNPQYALFGDRLVHPQNCYARLTEKWNQMTVHGLGERQEWRVQMGYEGVTRVVKLPNLVVSSDEGVWCDWREMFDAYFWSREPGRTE